MPKTKPAYPTAFKQQIVELAMAGRSPAELAREFDLSAQSVTAWMARAAADAGKPMWQGRLEQRRTRRASPIATPRAPARTGARHIGEGYGLVRGQGRQESSSTTTGAWSLHGNRSRISAARTRGPRSADTST